MALQASAPGELRGALGRLGYLCAEGGKAKFVAAADCSMLACTINGFGSARIVDYRTQWMPLSASINNPMVCGSHQGCCFNVTTLLQRFVVTLLKSGVTTL